MAFVPESFIIALNTTTPTPNVQGSDELASTVLVHIPTWGSGGAIAPQGSLNGVDFFALAAEPTIGGSAVTSFTAAGAWRINASGLAYLRFVPSGAGTGTVVLLTSAVEG